LAFTVSMTTPAQLFANQKVGMFPRLKGAARSDLPIPLGVWHRHAIRQLHDDLHA